MRTLFTKTILGGLVCGLSLCPQILLGQNPGATTPPAASSQAPQQRQPQQNSRIAPGTVLPVRLAKTVDAKKVKPGDEVVAQVTQDMKTVSGQVVVPKDTKVVGHVTEVQTHTKEQKESFVGIAFDHAVTKEGNSIASPMIIQAVVVQPNPANQTSEGAEPGASSPSSSAPTAAPGGRSPQMGTAGQSAPNSVPAASEAPSDSTNAGTQTPTITASTKGVVGIPNYQLSAAPDAHNGSVVTSEKNNVKLESGTFLLLRVEQ